MYRKKTRKGKKESLKTTSHFDFCAYLCKNVLKRSASGKKGMLPCCKCLLSRLELEITIGPSLSIKRNEANRTRVTGIVSGSCNCRWRKPESTGKVAFALSFGLLRTIVRKLNSTERSSPQNQAYLFVSELAVHHVFRLTQWADTWIRVVPSILAHTVGPATLGKKNSQMANPSSTVNLSVPNC